MWTVIEQEQLLARFFSRVYKHPYAIFRNNETNKQAICKKKGHNVLIMKPVPFEIKISDFWGVIRKGYPQMPQNVFLMRLKL